MPIRTMLTSFHPPTPRPRALLRRWRQPLLAGLAVLALQAVAGMRAGAQCPLEPSALDQRPAATPFTVRKDPSGSLALAWESVTADSYRVHRGDLLRLESGGGYNHLVVAESATPSATVPLHPGHDDYYVVDDVCSGIAGSVGRDSFGRERPYGGLVRVNLGVQGGIGVYGVQMLMTHPAQTTFVTADLVLGAGPYATGSPGSPTTLINANAADHVVCEALFLSFSPDPSFDPPPSTPEDVFTMTVGYHGPTPSASDFAITDCTISDINGSTVSGVTCLVSGFQVIY